MPTTLQVILVVNLAFGCWSMPHGTTLGSQTFQNRASPVSSLHSSNSTSGIPVSSNSAPRQNSTVDSRTPDDLKQNHTQSSVLQQDSDDGISGIIKHSKIFTEFLSFALNPVKSMDIVDTVRSELLSDKLTAADSQPFASETSQPSKNNATSTHPDTVNKTSSDSLLNHVQSHAGLQELFVEMTKLNSPGFIVSFDYLNITNKSSEGGTTTFREPVRMWGILPDDANNRTVYFSADYYSSMTYDAETKDSAKEQIAHFEQWKSGALSESDDKLGDGTIGSLLGGRRKR